MEIIRCHFCRRILYTDRKDSFSKVEMKSPKTDIFRPWAIDVKDSYYFKCKKACFAFDYPAEQEIPIQKVNENKKRHAKNEMLFFLAKMKDIHEDRI